ncbi:MAG TPA: MASE1 domain-containing protein [Candidatus Saccharimonadia bacterium]|nr:MASE1 domain-containing protein [Candidatus Saccharimonadia bacterium]
MSSLLHRSKKYTPKDVLILLTLFVAYFVAGKLGLTLAFFNPSATPIWAPTGIAITSFLFLGFGVWPAIFLGAFFVNLTTAGTVATSLGIALGNTLEGVAAAYLVQRFINKDTLFAKPENIFKYSVFAGLLATAVSATVGATTLLSAGLLKPHDYASVWLTWYLGDMGGALLVAPALILWIKDRRFSWGLSKTIELIVAFGLLILVSQVVFGGLSAGFSANYPLVFLCIPFLVWIAFRFGPRETSAALLVLYVIAALGTLHGMGPFMREDPNQSLLILQIFMGIMFLAKMPLAAASMQLKDREEKYKKLIQTSPDAILVLDLKGNLQVVDEQTMELYGTTDEKEMLGRSGFEFVAKEDVKKMQNALQTVIKEGKVSNIDYIALRKNGNQFYASANAALLFDTRGRPEGVMVILRDVTKEKEIDRAKSEFFALVAHQLRAPLSVMRWNIELLLSGKENGASTSTRTKLEDIYDNTKGLIALVNSLLDISRAEKGVLPSEPEDTDAADIVRDVVRDMKGLADAKSVTVHAQIEEPIEKVFVDPKRFREVVANLVSNAVKYNKQDGQVDVLLKHQGNALHLEVTDTGIGISPTDRSVVFQKFYRSAQAKQMEQEGSGLGLFMVKSFVESVGGKVWFTSPVQDGAGTTFYIEIPLKGVA